MAVFTNVDRKALIEFLDCYDIGLLLNYQGIVQGVENTNYSLLTDRSRYILTIFENRTKTEELCFIFDYCQALSEGGIVCPLTLSDCAGGRIGMLMEKPASIVTFLDGTQLNSADIKPKHLHSLGRYMARMHLCATEFDQRRNNPVGMEFWENMRDVCHDKANTVYAGLSDLITDELIFLKANWPNDLPEGTVHTDLFPDNVFYQNDEVCGVIDFYFSCTTFLTYDIAIVIGAWCFDEKHIFMPERFQALMNGYQSVRVLSDKEQQALPLLCRAQALRFLMTRLHDWIFHPEGVAVVPKDPKEYIYKLQFHQDNPAAVRCDNTDVIRENI